MDVRFKRRCEARVALTDEECRQAPLREKDYCFWHDPEIEEAAQGLVASERSERSVKAVWRLPLIQRPAFRALLVCLDSPAPRRLQ